MPSQILQGKLSNQFQEQKSFENAFHSFNSIKELKQYIRQSDEFCKKISDIMTERATIENRYAKEISTLSHKLIKCSTNFMGTMSNAYHELAVEFDSEAENHRLFSNSLNDDIVKPIKTILESYAKKRKAIESGMERMTKSYHDKQNIDFKYRQKLFRIANLIGEDDKQKDIEQKTKDAGFMRKNGDRLHRSLGVIEQKCISSTTNVEYARQNLNGFIAKTMNVIESMEIERMDVISIAFNKIISCIEIMGERSNVTSSKLKNVKFSIEQDLHELIVSYGDSSQQPHEIQIYDIPAEDFKIQISRSLREEMLARWISRMDVLIQHCGKSLRGIENLTKFCKENTKFAIPSGDAQTTRISTEMLAALYEASRYKFKTALDTLDNRPTQNHDISWLIVHTLHKNIPISFLRLHNSFKWSSGKQLQSNNGIQNGFMSDDNKIAGNNISPYPNISNGMIRNIENRRELCVVQFRYLARRPDELTINPGDVVSVIEKRPDKWWKGKLGTQCGLFPSTYVEEIDV